MIPNPQKTSLLVPFQLPQFVRENPEYSNFQVFLQAYYEWLELANTANSAVTEAASTGQGAGFGSSNLLQYTDIDTTIDAFIDYYVNDFLPYFPKESLVNQQKAVKFAKQLYQSKGTPASYQFLFRILYNSDFEYYKTSDTILRASAGTWYVAKSLKLATSDLRFLQTKNLRVFGETSKSIATIENAILVGNKIEVFISNIERLFESGEIIRIVDNDNQDVLINGTILTSKVVGQVSQINLKTNNKGVPLNRGTLYQVGDPVIVYGGLNPDIQTPIGATAEIGTVTSGAITGINTIKGGFGYSLYPNTKLTITNAPGANAIVYSVDPNANTQADVFMFPTDSIYGKLSVVINANNYNFVNSTWSNANTSIGNTLNFISFSTYPISSVAVINGGGGISTLPQVTAHNTQKTDINGDAYLDKLGILAPIQIANAGRGYRANDVIRITGGNGYGARANITVNSAGSITGVRYVYQSNTARPQNYPLGGMGYNNEFLPTVTVISSNTQAANASLFVPGILGAGASFSVTTQKIGSVTTINLTNNGEDYVSSPNVSLSVQDILVSNADILLLPAAGDFIYQGNSPKTTSYSALVDSVRLLNGDVNTFNSLYNIRVFNYNSQPNSKLPLVIANKNINLRMANTAADANRYYIGSPEYNGFGIKNYGDGAALAKASFLNGLVFSQGQYLDTSGQPSSFDVLESDIYNDFTYQITVEREIEKYRNVVLNLLHPAGTKLRGRYALRSNTNIGLVAVNALYKSTNLRDYTGDTTSAARIVADFTNRTNNIVQLSNTAGANIATFIFTDVPGTPNSVFVMTTSKGPNVRSEVVGVDYANNRITLKDSVILTYSNVAYVTANANTNIINIRAITNSYNVMNNGVYSNTAYPLKDIVFAGDTIKISTNTFTVSSVNYQTGILYVSSNVTSNIANSFVSVNRTIQSSGKSVRIIGPIGLEYVPELITEDGLTIITENGSILILE
jgi:hypothetical protein